jgi:hypothetical protein
MTISVTFLSTPSLGITIRTPAVLPEELAAALSTPSRGITCLIEKIITCAGTGPFNSLSRDHRKR